LMRRQYAIQLLEVVKRQQICFNHISYFGACPLEGRRIIYYELTFTI